MLIYSLSDLAGALKLKSFFKLMSGMTNRKERKKTEITLFASNVEHFWVEVLKKLYLETGVTGDVNKLKST